MTRKKVIASFEQPRSILQREMVHTFSTLGLKLVRSQADMHLFSLALRMK